MCLKKLFIAVLLLCLTGVCVAGTSIVPTTTLAAQTANNTSTVNGFASQSNGNSGAGNVSKVDVHSLLYPGATTKIYAHLMLWFGGSNHMNVGYSSTDPAQIHRQISDMISRGIDGVVIDWYGQNNSIDDATKLVMAEAETHPGFTFAIMVDQGAIEWYSCPGCSAQQALISDLQYIEQTYFSSSAYMTLQGQPVITNFNIDLSYSVDWTAVNAALSRKPVYLFQNNDGFTHVLSGGSYSWVMPTTTDYGVAYLTSFYQVGMPLSKEETVGAAYKGFNDTLASWGSNRVMGQQCGQTWLKTFSEVNSLYNSAKQLAALQLVTWNDYEEGTEIESGINSCASISASFSSNALQWTLTGKESTVDHYVAYISTDGKNLMSLGNSAAGISSTNLCSYSLPNGSYTAYVQAVGKPSIVNLMSKAVKVTLSCGSGTTNNNGSFTVAANPAALTVASGKSGNLTVTVSPLSGSFDSSVGLSCSGLPQNLTCSFAPSAVTPGGKPVTSVLTITAAHSTASNRYKGTRFLFASSISAFGLLGIALVGSVKRKTIVGLAITGAILLCLTLSSCAGQSAPAVKASASTPVASTYVLNINGSAGATDLSTTVTVTVQ